jgi:hypothetical protein
VTAASVPRIFALLKKAGDLEGCQVISPAPKPVPPYLGTRLLPGPWIAGSS